MAIGVIDGKPFGQGGGVEFGIGREQRHRRVGGMDFQNRSELHGIIAAQTMPSTSSECRTAGAARACTQPVPVSCTYRLTTVLVSRKQAATVNAARG